MSITMLGQADARSRLGVGLQPRRWSGDPNAWKRALGNNNRVPARLEVFLAADDAVVIQVALLEPLPPVLRDGPSGGQGEDKGRGHRPDQ